MTIAGYEYITCPLCGGIRERARYLVLDLNYRIVQCQLCGFVYENPRPLPANLLALYDVAYFDYLTENTGRNLEIAKLNLRDINFDDYEKGLSDNEKHILDVGCEKGTFLEYMRDRGWTCYGVEPGDGAYDIASKKKGLKVYHGELLEANFSSDFFQVVHLNNVIEHVTNPLEVLRECYRVLKPSALLIVVTPNYGSLARYLRRDYWRDFIAIHICFFTKKTIKRTLIDIGFQIRGQYSWGGGFPNTSTHRCLKRSVDKITKKLNAGDQSLTAAIKAEG